MRVLLAALAVGVLLASCQTAKPPPMLVEPPPPPAPIVEPPPPPLPPAMPGRVSCVPRGFPRSPKYPDTDQALRNAGGAADRYQLLAAGRLARVKRLTELERLVDACR